MSLARKLHPDKAHLRCAEQGEEELDVADVEFEFARCSQAYQVARSKRRRPSLATPPARSHLPPVASRSPPRPDKTMCAV